jgi:hypothetical protein
MTLSGQQRESRSLNCDTSEFLKFPPLGHLQNCILKNYSDEEFAKNETTFPTFHSISLDSFPLKKFPSNLGRVFPNLTAIEITNAMLPELKSVDLSPYARNLQYLNVSGNEIDTIDGDLFRNCSNLKFVDMSNNYIFYIDGRAFDELKISFITLKENGCVDGEARNDIEMKGIMRRVRGECNKNYLVLELHRRERERQKGEKGECCCKEKAVDGDKNVY